jgi:purine-binding chemotaxis protein CheW
MQNNKESQVEAGAGNGDSRKMLTFSLGGEVYGVDILRVKEIRGWSPVTRIPQSASSVLGVLNLRGTVVPIIDLRLRFGMKSAEFTPITVIIVLSLNNGSGQREVGIVVDSVKDVVDIDVASIKPAPSMSSAGTNGFIEGIATYDEQMLILLDAECLASKEQPTTGLADQAA